MAEDAVHLAERRGRSKSKKIQDRVILTMSTIDREVASNGGTYPYNNGRISRDELCRRAEINRTTLHTDAQKKFKAESVDPWLKRYAASEVSDAAKEVTTHEEIISELVFFQKTLESNLRLAELEIQNREHEIVELRARLDAIQANWARRTIK